MTAATLTSRSARRLDNLPISNWHKRTTVLVGIGSFFDLYEVFLGGVLATVLSKQWHLSANGKALVISSAFIGMFVGANVLSALADRIGRRKVFLINLTVYSVISIANAFAPNYASFIVLRILCGIGVGAELVLVDTYLSEFLPVRVRGRYVSWAYVVGFLGVPLAALIGARAVAANHLLGLDGWRWLLIIGGVGAVIVLAFRTALPESPRWLELQGRQQEADRIVDDIVAHSGTPATASNTITEASGAQTRVPKSAARRELFSPVLRRRTVMLPIFQVLQTVGYYGFGTLAPLVLLDKGYTITNSLTFSALSFLGYPIGALVAVPIVERVERKFLIIGSALLMAVFGIVFGLSTSTVVIVIAGFLLTVASNIFSNGFHVYQAEIFPTAFRTTAMGSCYSLSRTTSAVLPFIAVSALATFHAVGVFSASAVILVLLCIDVAVLGPRSTGRSLESVNEAVDAPAAPR